MTFTLGYDTFRRSTRLVVSVHKLANYFTLTILIGWAMASLGSVMFADDMSVMLIDWQTCYVAG